MLKSELHQLEGIIGTIVNSNETAGHELRARGTNFTALLEEACNILKKKWEHELFSNVKEPVITRYIQYHQAGIITLSDQIAGSLASAGRSGNILIQAVRNLEDLLEFLEKRFYKFFDFNHVLSADRFVNEKKNIIARLGSVSDKLTELKIDRALIGAIQNAINGKLDGAHQDSLSYREVAYLKGLFQVVEEHVQDSTLDTKDVEALLYRHNFNSEYFERYYHTRLAAAIGLLPEKKRKPHIGQELQILASRFPDRGKKFEIDLPSIDEMLQSSPLRRPTGSVRGNDKAALRRNGPVRMPLTLSVAQFGLFIRLCYLEGCFPVNNISDILRFFTFHFETKKQLNISVNSFRRTFYAADQANAAIIRDFLQRMLDHLDRTYFPKT